MHFIYNIAVSFYYLFIYIASLFNDKAGKWIKGRRDVWQLAEDFTKKNKHQFPVIWFHCASLGEFEQARPVIEKYKQLNPSALMVLTFFSPSGYEVRRNYPVADLVCYLPTDTPANVKKFIQLIQPAKVVFVKYEFWYNYIIQLAENKIPLIFISVILRRDQYFFRWYGAWFREQLKNISYFFVQDTETLDLLKSVGIDKVKVAGDTRFDRVIEISKQAKIIKEVEEFSENKPLIVAGSTWSKDDDLLAEVFLRINPNCKFIIAPHNIDEQNIQSTLLAFKEFNPMRFSQFNSSDIIKSRLLVIDNMGMLSSIYRYAKIVYVGGGFGVAVHNTLEPAVYGVPVLFGPNYHKFNEAKELIKCKGGYSISTNEELKELLDTLITDEYLYTATAKAAGNYVYSNKGATDVIMKNL